MSDGGMNEWLADFYGTDADGDELEKAAQAALLEKLAEGDVDIDSLSDDEVIEMASELGLTEDDLSDDGELDDHQKVAMITKVAEANDIDIAELDEEEFEQLTAVALDPATWEETDEPSDHEKIAMISKLAEVSDIDIAELDEDQFNELAAVALNPETWEGEGGHDLSDHEKIAMITKVAEANEIDIADLSEEEFEQLAEVALDPETWEDDEETKVAQAQFAEADFLGRVMAHAQYNELEKIAKGGGSLWARGKKGVLDPIGRAFKATKFREGGAAASKAETAKGQLIAAGKRSKQGLKGPARGKLPGALPGDATRVVATTTKGKARKARMAELRKGLGTKITGTGKSRAAGLKLRRRGALEAAGAYGGAGAGAGLLGYGGYRATR